MLCDHILSRSSSADRLQEDYVTLPAKRLLCPSGIFLAGPPLSPKDQRAGEMARIPSESFPQAPDDLMADELHLFGPHVGRKPEVERGIPVVQKATPLQHDIPQARAA